MRPKRVLSVAFLLALVLALGSVFAALLRDPAPAGPDAFAGTRQLEFTVDSSDLENFVNGGRSALDLRLRMAAPDWLDFSLSAQDRSVILSMGFSFRDQQEYRDRLAALLGHSPGLLCLTEDDLCVLEGHPAARLLGFLQTALSAGDGVDEVQLQDLFQCTQNDITINGDDYSGGDWLTVYEGEGPARLDGLTVTTAAQEDGSFVRRIEALIDRTAGSAGRVDTLTEQMERVTAVQRQAVSDSVTSVTAEFTALDIDELTQKTMLCLNVPVSLARAQRYPDGQTVLVDQQEDLDVEDLLHEGSDFRYVFTFPAYAQNVTARSAGTTAEGTTLSAMGQAHIRCRYKAKPAFSSVTVTEDCSSLLHRVTRTTVFSVPSQLAEPFHEDWKLQLERRYPAGTEIDIRDEGGMRTYQVVEHSPAGVQIKYSPLPFGHCTVSDEGRTMALPDMAPPERASVCYVLPWLTFGLQADGNEHMAAKQGTSITFFARGSDDITFSARSVSVPSLLLMLLLLAVCAVLWRRLVRRRRTKQAADRFCGECGAPIPAGAEACSVCGTPVQRNE